MQYTYVIGYNNTPLMPTTRSKHVRELINQGLAKVVCITPFTIQLTYQVIEPIQHVVLGIDPGRTNIGIAAIKANSECVFRAHADTNNKNVTKRMKNRKAERQMRRQHRREKKRRRAVDRKTRKAEKFKRLLPGCDTPIECHDIRNKEARFNNRKRPSGWLTPTARQLVNVTISLIERMRKILPINMISIEINKFCFALMDDPSITGLDFQNGPLKGFDNVESAVRAYQNGKCLMCGCDHIDHIHHIVPRHLGGSDTLPNRTGLCSKCHDKVHKDEKAEAELKKLKAGMNKKYGALSVLNQALPFIVKEIYNLGLNVVFTYGNETHAIREMYDLPKTHSADAYVIACNGTNKEPQTALPDEYELQHFRRHDRAAINTHNYNREYYSGEKKVCTNRHKATEQKTDSLEEYRAKHTEQEISRLTVKKHKPEYKTKKEYSAGSVFKHNGKTYALQKYESTAANKDGSRRPQTCIDTQGNKHPFLKAKFILHNGGWMYA